MDKTTAGINQRMRKILALPMFVFALLAGVTCTEFAWSVFAQAGDKHMSDREKAGLRGPVKTCIETSRSGGVTANDGTFIPEQTYFNTTEYDTAGNVVVADDSQSATHTDYDAQGRIIKKTLKIGKETMLPSLCTDIEESGGRKKKNHLETLKMLL